MATGENPAVEAMLKARNRELARAIQLRIKWLEDRVKRYERQAYEAFEGHNVALSYRLLGQTQEARRNIKELYVLYHQVMEGEQLETAA